MAIGSKRKAKRLKNGVPINILMKNTPNQTTVDAQSVKILRIKNTRIRIKPNSDILRLPAIKYLCRSPVPNTALRPPQHWAYVALMPNSTKSLWISCNCEFFMYRCEYALSRYGGSTILYGNGQPAVVTNPSNKPYCCKHLFKVLGRKSTLTNLQSMMANYESA